MSLTRNDLIFSKLAISEGLITKQQFKDCKAIQKRLDQKGKTVRIGAILVSKRIITKTQVEAIKALWQEMKKKRTAMMCLACGARYRINGYFAGKKVACKKCGEPLETVKNAEKIVNELDKSLLVHEKSSQPKKASADNMDYVRDILAVSQQDSTNVAKTVVFNEPISAETDLSDFVIETQTAAATAITDTVDTDAPTAATDTKALKEAAAAVGGTEALSPSQSALDTVDDTEKLLANMIHDDVTPEMTIKIDRTENQPTSTVNMNIRPLEVSIDMDDAAQNDFEIVGSIGKGGMAEVYSARQASIDRQVALKMIRSDITDDDEVRYKFISEAVVTGYLDHPNIVPIHDLGRSQDGKLFYAMKQVIGTSWNQSFSEKSKAENIDILLRVCDAVAFAHDRGITHRDLKPLNVMLGDYGEVLVMDWGLAISSDQKGKAEKLPAKIGMAGTPAYMAPEMAKCESHLIGPRSDIYLLGGILYKIVTGLRPHHGETVISCVYEAIKNNIQPTNEKGELVDIALKAMATNPEDRYGTVIEFQKAIRDYQAHSKSIELAARAIEDIKHAKATKDYESFAQGLFGFRQALEMWSDNTVAEEGLASGTIAYAECAYEKDDFDLADSLLSMDNPQHRDLAGQVEKARTKRDQRKKKLKLLTFGSTALAIAIIVILAVAFFWIRGEKEKAVAAEKEARIAESNEKEQRQKAELENYFNVLTIAKQKISNLLIDQAESLLKQSPETLRGWEWGRLMQLCNLNLVNLKGHTGSIEALAFSPDGKRLVTGSRDQSAKIWEVETGNELFDLKGHTGAVVYVAFSTDGKRIVTVTQDGSVKNWDPETGKELEVALQPVDTVRSISSSPDGKRKVMTRHDESNAAVTLDPATGQELMRLKGHSDRVLAVAFSPDGKRVVTGSQDKTAKIWDVESGREILTLKGHAKGIGAVLFSPDGSLIATGSNDTTVKIWGTEGGHDIEFKDPDSRFVQSVAFSPDGKQIVTGSRTKIPIVWDAETGITLKKLTGHTDYVSDVAFSPDKRWIASASRDKTAIIWDAQSGSPIKTLKGHTGSLFSVAFSPDSRLLLTGSWDKTAKIWEVSSGRLLKTLSGGHMSAILAVGFSPDSRLAATGSKDKTTDIWDVETGQKLKTLKGHANSVYGLAFSPDGNRIATASWDTTVKIWDLPAGTQIKTLQGHSKSVQAVAFSPDGKRLATGSWDNTIKIWDPATGRELLTVRGHTNDVYDVTFSPDGKRIASASRDNTAKIWNALAW
jgi:WD40 repeat protein/serine/threonine protein kinase